MSVPQFSGIPKVGPAPVPHNSFSAEIRRSIKEGSDSQLVRQLEFAKAAGYDLNDPGDPCGSFLHMAIAADNANATRLLLDAGADRFYCAPSTGHSALMLAAINPSVKSLAVIEALLKPDDLGAEAVRQALPNGMTAIVFGLHAIQAAKAGSDKEQIDIAEQFLHRLYAVPGVDIGETQRGEKAGYNLLHIAAMGCHAWMFGALKNALDSPEQQAQFRAAAQATVGPEAVNLHHGMTPMHMAAIAGDVRMIVNIAKTIGAEGVNQAVNDPESPYHEMTPLQLSCSNAHQSKQQIAIKALVQNGADPASLRRLTPNNPWQNNMNVLQMLVANGNQAAFEVLVNEGLVHPEAFTDTVASGPEAGKTLFHLAMMSGQLLMAAHLLTLQSKFPFDPARPVGPGGPSAGQGLMQLAMYHPDPSARIQLMRVARTVDADGLQAQIASGDLVRNALQADLSPPDLAWLKIAGGDFDNTPESRAASLKLAIQQHNWRATEWLLGTPPDPVLLRQMLDFSLQRDDSVAAIWLMKELESEPGEGLHILCKAVSYGAVRSIKRMEKIAGVKLALVDLHTPVEFNSDFKGKTAHELILATPPDSRLRHLLARFEKQVAKHIKTPTTHPKEPEEFQMREESKPSEERKTLSPRDIEREYATFANHQKKPQSTPLTLSQDADPDLFDDDERRIQAQFPDATPHQRSKILKAYQSIAPGDTSGPPPKFPKLLKFMELTGWTQRGQNGSHILMVLPPAVINGVARARKTIPIQRDDGDFAKRLQVKQVLQAMGLWQYEV
ncbi:MAG: hypothetical protein Q8N17_12935 [Burkholderiaceae bacterium]|nr:hypothetical protein [Burkholderiaceae bacterium]